MRLEFNLKRSWKSVSRQILVLVSFRRLQCVFFWVACPLPGKLARVGGHRRQPVLNPAMHKASDAGHIRPHGMRRCLSFSLVGTCPVPPTPPPRPKNGPFFEECSMCIKHRKYRQKLRLGGVGLGQGAGAQKSRTPGGNCFF